MAQVVDRLSQQYGDRVTFVKVDVDASPALAAEYGIRGVPTFLVLQNGKPVSRVGATSASGTCGAIRRSNRRPSEPRREGRRSPEYSRLTSDAGSALTRAPRTGCTAVIDPLTISRCPAFPGLDPGKH